MNTSIPTRIKFCGITRAEDARLANELGAAYVGCIFADSPRRVAPADTPDIWREAHTAKKVGVFGASSVSEILEVADAAALDVIQLHAGASAGIVEELRASFRGEIWNVLRVGEDGALAGEAVTDGDGVLVDTLSESRLGGTGRPFDWKAAAIAVREAAGERALILAGGLNPENVGAAIRALRPDVVDVSSGVESSPGIKNPARMRAFAEAVQAANDQ